MTTNWNLLIINKFLKKIKNSKQEINEKGLYPGLKKGANETENNCEYIQPS